MADVNRGNRPLSPHLSIYRPQLTSATSIFARITGVALLGAAVLVVWWFLAAASGPEYFDLVNGLMTSFLGDLVMFAALWAICYHFLSGLRHLYWDTGRGLEIETAEKLAKGVIIGSFVLTFLFALIV
ncbi:succinate dehydrogenase, cytochrome b556 subunit [Shimia thalassica]|jgi:succinate dehydrogenase / fumarate reductase cytochrome b subunit|uniref:Succinate dehydrogenase cytochrome b556 subunit n=1 Tax=Shimia thalassica TaxID=1715693 RepID=A0A0P1ID07_9RHOB|nr:succinate dehydrogenase, cytochrome b556 subunit [Shimia thalassica]PHO04359.1 succinate dehydrogenase, cytochrome b556 subunit [Rhodobacteraceae bacterium 4F10]MBU2943695.1 succinate dehydrogenase, cytochrome b556 subunit [Shimia thalassica]MDO6478493.1 succinate dehydrogenase, cytochrome b556 subunit [Shimia thalassica]MDO6484778.1 succinate dehydrogenase, cytochrome b556 subunit [Shimia thalassica]MDO6501766.1 succinate dehydrogenase, cytochrome b556 subunit [Shimia thalassica]